jgi:hypothetical protein
MRYFIYFFSSGWICSPSTLFILGAKQPFTRLFCKIFDPRTSRILNDMFNKEILAFTE